MSLPFFSFNEFEYIRIDAEDEYTGFTTADPRIGFRYFVEIIEE